MTRPLTAVLLAGTLRPSPLTTELALPVLCLPIGPAGRLLDAWLEVLAGVGHVEDVRLVVGNDADARAIVAALESSACSAMTDAARLRARVMREPAAWRGPGGLVRDAVADVAANSGIIVIEPHSLPPRSLTPLAAAFEAGLSGIVGVAAGDRPAGVYAFTRAAIDMVPPVGYCDLKEQLLPALRERGERVVTADLGEGVLRIRDGRSYLAAVAASLSGGDPPQRLSARASISGSAVMDGPCIIESGAVVEDGAVVHASVIMDGATVGGGAIVSRSVVGPLASVPPRSRVVDAIVGGSSESPVPDPKPARRDGSVRSLSNGVTGR
jgi:hypothetical protein